MFVLITHCERIGQVVVGIPSEVIVTPRETKLQKPAPDHPTTFVDDGHPTFILLDLPHEDRFSSPVRYWLHKLVSVFKCPDGFREGPEQLLDLFQGHPSKLTLHGLALKMENMKEKGKSNPDLQIFTS